MTKFLYFVLWNCIRFKKDNQQVVKESCIVALDMHEYENSGEFLTLEQGVDKIVKEVQLSSK